MKSKAQSVQERLAQAAQSTEHFRKRLAGLVSGALVFNVLSSGLRTLTNWMGAALLSSSSLRTALGNLQGAAGHGSRAHHSDTYPRADCAGKCGGDGVQLHCAAGGVLYRAHNLRQRRSSQGYERRRIGGGQRSEEGQGR